MSTNRNSVFMTAGMFAVFFYVLHIIVGSILWKGYNQVHQPISDLTATGAPNQNLLLLLTTIYGILAAVFAFSFSIHESTRHNKTIIWGGICFCAMTCVSLSYGLFPEDLPNQQITFLGTMHIVVTALLVPFTILSPLLIGIGFRKEQGWAEFGNYSIFTGIWIFVFGGASAMFFANKWPYFGIVERLNIGALELWIFRFSLKLFRAK